MCSKTILILTSLMLVLGVTTANVLGLFVLFGLVAMTQRMTPK